MCVAGQRYVVVRTARTLSNPESPVLDRHVKAGMLDVGFQFLVGLSRRPGPPATTPEASRERRDENRSDSHG